MMINAEEEKQLLDQLGVVGSAEGTHYQQTVEFGMRTHVRKQVHTIASSPDLMHQPLRTIKRRCVSLFVLRFVYLSASDH